MAFLASAEVALRGGRFPGLSVSFSFSGLSVSFSFSRWVSEESEEEEEEDSSWLLGSTGSSGSSSSGVDSLSLSSLIVSWVLPACIISG